jgi:hypothetical protein
MLLRLGHLQRQMSLFDRRILRSLFYVVQVKGSGREDGILNYINDMISQIWLSVWAGYVIRMVMIGQLRECLASSQKEREELEDLK